LEFIPVIDDRKHVMNEIQAGLNNGARTQSSALTRFLDVMSQNGANLSG